MSSWLRLLLNPKEYIRITRTERQLMFAVAAILALTLSLIYQVTAHAAPPKAKPQAYCPMGCTGTYYGANGSWLLTATDDWFEHQGNWCGIATVTAMERYDWIKASNNWNPTYKTQESVASLLNSSGAVSPWGQAQPGDGGPGPAFKADIAADGGTDPRSLSWAAYTVTPGGYYFHNWIYATGANFPGNQTATYDFGADFGPYRGLNDPISVTIKYGKHSFLIGGVWASSDPSAGGETIYDIDTWDPWLNRSDQAFDGHKYYNQYQNEDWSLSDWLGLNGGPQFMWSYAYATSNGYDPEPSTGYSGFPYYQPPFTNGQNWHWNGTWVTIEQDLVTRCNGSPDIAYDQNGNEANHHAPDYCP